MSEKYQDMRELQKQHRGNQNRKNGNKGRRHGGNAPMPAISGGRITGKNITRFPVYLRSNSDRTQVHVCRHFEEVQKLLEKGGSWECLGTAPLDITAALVSAEAEVQYSVTREFGLFRVLEIEGNVITLFPSGKLEASSSWMERFRPYVGAWVIRQGLHELASRDSFVTMGDKAFRHTHGRLMDPEVLDEINTQFNQVRELLEEKRLKERDEAEHKAALAAQAAAEAEAETMKDDAPEQETPDVVLPEQDAEPVVEDAPALDISQEDVKVSEETDTVEEVPADVSQEDHGDGGITV